MMKLEEYYEVNNENALDEQDIAQIQEDLANDLDAVEQQIQEDLANPNNEFNHFQNFDKFTACTGNVTYFLILKPY